MRRRATVEAQMPLAAAGNVIPRRAGCEAVDDRLQVAFRFGAEVRLDERVHLL
jgi:hypothetical protein